MNRARILAGVAIAAATLSLTACGGGGAIVTTAGAKHPRPLPQTLVRIYSGLVMRGSTPAAVAGRAIEHGIQLAIVQRHHHAGRFKVRYTALDDGTAAGALGVDRLQSDADKVATDAQAMLYIGGLSTRASSLSAPILNQAGISQISVGTTYVGLTDAVPNVSAGGEPQRYYPTGTRTLLRLLPSDAVQVAAELVALRQHGCSTIALLHGATRYDTGLATMMSADAKEYGVAIAAEALAPHRAAAIRTLAAGLHDHGIGCVALIASPSAATTALTVELHLQLPRASIIAPSQLCVPAWTNAGAGGVPATVAPALECTRPVLAYRALPGGDAFLSDYRAQFHRGPASFYAIYGYEAAMLGLDMISELGAKGDDRVAINRSLFGIRDRRSVIGTYGFTVTGDTTLDSYGLYRVGVHGNPEFASALSTGR